jgi:beta-lactamase regulating signal transducer with metallopeptidase domain
MNDLGLTLAWLAVQVAILLAPALALQALATRRGPAPGAWVATLSLGLVVALNVAAFMPEINRKDPASAIASTTMSHGGTTAPTIRPRSASGVDGPDVIHPAGGRGRGLAWLRLAWDRLGRGAAEPAVRVRPWGNILAIAAMAGIAAGLLRLTIGIWAVTLCYRRGQPVDDPTMTGLLDELQSAMGCRRPVMLREVPDLTTPATAGRRRPVLLLPDDWRSWSVTERRAVLAHELAHIVRGDYATGLLARLAVVLNYYHPLVRWMAARLQLQQEQAADTLGARFAGGPTRYLVALSSLALRQDGRSPSWPARAFLPARGTLIRRIAMLRDGSKTQPLDRPWSSARRMLTAFSLLSLTIGVATLRGPVHGAEDGPPPAARAGATAPEPRDQTKPFEPLYLREGADAVAIVRPAAILRQKGMDRIISLVGSEALGIDLADMARQLKVDVSRPGFLKLRTQDIEYATTTVTFGRGKGASGEPLHSLMFGCMTARTVESFDWLAFLRQWRFEWEEARVRGHVYYKIKGVFKEVLGKIPCLYLPDDRTIVYDEEDVIRKIASGEAPALPAFLRGKEWQRASRGVVALAIKNSDDTLASHFDLGRPNAEDAVVLSLFKGIDWWVFGFDAADSIVLRADASTRGRDASETVSRQIDSLIKLGRQALLQALDPKSPQVAAHENITRMFKALAENVRVEHTDTAISVQTKALGSLADFAAIFNDNVYDTINPVAAENEVKDPVKRK